MQLTVMINMDNAEATETPDYAGASYLRKVADKLEAGYTAGRVMDGNGNGVGLFTLGEDKVKVSVHGRENLRSVQDFDGDPADRIIITTY